uniref:Importin N-terminal domain-containing protein n=1 Tax=Chlamydomonas euryale TaxID=1486919 RepID=A0A7R9YU85_9CHLO|mmetsp:Transcript_24532/g.72702  ORF Transcript_24532/g.72702 Transcript_24532/m.72702 type:complete len:1038 (+) Transcript_24532:185-3298(+)
MDINQLCTVLAACIGADATQRTAAEEVLKQHEAVQGQAVNMLRVAAEEQVDAAVRQVAAISFKNLVKKYWEPASPGQPCLREEDRAVVRENLLEALIRSPHMVQLQIGEVFKMVVYADFPEKWPNLLAALWPNLVSQDEGRLYGGLYALRMVARKYEFRDASERDPLREITSAALPVLLQLLQQLLLNTSGSNQVAMLIKLVCKIFWSCTYMEIPDVLLQDAQFVGWMQCLLAFATQPVPAYVDQIPAADRHSHPWWKAKKWGLHISYRLFHRYSVAKHAKEGNDKAFAERFVRDCRTPFLEAHMQLVAATARGAYLSPRCLNLVFQFLTQALEVKDTYAHGRTHWDGILHNIAFPILCFNEADAQLWEEDPHEYIRKGYDIMEDMYSPKTAVANFAHELCSKKKAHLDAFMAMIVQVLNTYQAKAQAGSATAADASRMDGAMMAVGVMVRLLKHKKPYKQQLGPMLSTCIVPCFASPAGHLRAKAAWLCGVFSDTEFADGKGQGATYSLLLQHVVACLADTELAVRVDAAVSIRYFVEEVEDVAILRPILPNLLSSIFQLMGEVDAEELLSTLEAIVEKFDEEIAPFALQMAQQLGAAFWKYVNTADEDDEDEMGAFAAYGCIKALNTLLASVSNLPDLYGPLEDTLFPIMQKMLTREGEELFDEVLEMLAYFTFYAPCISERLWGLWPLLHAALCEWGIDYWESLLVPLDNMISRDTQRFLTCKNPDYLASVYKMVEYSLKGDFRESEIVCAPKLLEIVLQACRGQVDACVGPYLQLVLAKLPSTESRSLKDMLVLVVANALYYNAPLAMAMLSQQGAVGQFFTAWFGLIFVSRKSGKPGHFRRMHDKKVCVLGLVSVLATPDEQLPPEIQAGMPQIMAGLLRLLTALKAQKEETDALAGEGDGEPAWPEDDDDGDDDDDNDDGDEAARDAYMARLAKMAATKAGDGGDDDNDDDDGDEEWTDDEEVEMPIDPVDPWVLFVDQLSALSAANPVRHQALLAGLDAGAVGALQAVSEFAEKQRMELAKQAAAAAAGQ